MGQHWSHLTPTKRIQLDAFIRAGMKPTDIAKELGVHHTTIYRELKRCTYEHLNSDYTTETRYNPEGEQARYEASMRASGIALGHGDEHVRPAFINTPHSAIESMWFQYAMKDVPQTVASVTGDTPDVRWISMNTDPWNMVIPSSGQER